MHAIISPQASRVTIPTITPNRLSTVRVYSYVCTVHTYRGPSRRARRGSTTDETPLSSIARSVGAGSKDHQSDPLAPPGCCRATLGNRTSTRHISSKQDVNRQKSCPASKTLSHHCPIRSTTYSNRTVVQFSMGCAGAILLQGRPWRHIRVTAYAVRRESWPG